MFDPAYNSPLDPKLLTQYKTVIFSDYKLGPVLFDAYKSNNFNGIEYVGSSFNQVLGDSFKKCTKLEKLTFGYDFDQNLSNSLHGLSSLTHLTFNGYFNQNLGNSLHGLSSLTHLTFGRFGCFNQNLGNSLHGLTTLTHLTFGYYFNQNLTNYLLQHHPQIILVVMKYKYHQLNH